jgi:hypothetical protein
VAWLIAILVGLGVTTGASILVEWASRSARREPVADGTPATGISAG